MLKEMTINGENYENRSSYTFDEGEYVVVTTVSKPGYADVTYTVTITVSAAAKDGGDAEGEPDEEPIKATRSTKSSK